MKIIYKILLVLYLIVGVIPNFDALDKVVTQWLYINLLNTFSLIFLLVKNYPLKKYFFNKSSVLFFCLFFWSATTAFFAINPIESIVVLSQIFAIVIAFVIIMVCITEIKDVFKFIANILSIFLLIELSMIYLPFHLIDDLDLGIIFNRSRYFLGLAANINITAFSIIYKIPFFIYSLMQIKKLKVVIIPLAFLIFFIVIFASGTLNSTRSAILAYTFLAPILLIISSVIYFKTNHSKLLMLSVTYSLSLILSFSFNSYLSTTLEKKESNITNRISSLNALIDNEQEKDGSLTQRLNFYSHAIKSIKENPIFGIGIGNWKIVSINFNKENVIGYRIPYHVHNDYLEIGAEIGLIGLGIYLLILFFGFKETVLNFIKILFTKEKLNSDYLICVMLSLFIFIFIIDSNINFPFNRPIVFINLITMLAYLNSKKIKEDSYES